MTRLIGEDGEWHGKDNRVNEVVLEYFQKLFRSHNGEMDEVLRCVRSRVTNEANEDLMRPFTREEVRNAIFSMHLDKAPGEDALNPGFYQKYWQS